jgi:hypothetical protein
MGVGRRIARVGRGFAELWAFMRVRKKLWLAPVIVLLLVIGGLLVVTEGSVLAPFLYALF